MSIRCHFDPSDLCVGYDIAGVTLEMTGGRQFIDSGLYDLPAGYNPLGKTAIDLYIYASK